MCHHRQGPRSCALVRSSERGNSALMFVSANPSQIKPTLFAPMSSYHESRVHNRLHDGTDDLPAHSGRSVNTKQLIEHELRTCGWCACNVCRSSFTSLYCLRYAESQLLIPICWFALRAGHAGSLKYKHQWNIVCSAPASLLSPTSKVPTTGEST